MGRNPAFAALALLLTIFTGLYLSSATAQESKEETKSPVERLEVQTRELLSGLDEQQLRFVYATRMRDGSLRAVQYIQGMVSSAVEKCGEAQPDMKEDLESRYTRWWGTLAPIMDEARDKLQKTISAQEEIPEEDILLHLKLVDEAASHTRARSEREIVTTREACQYLLENMDKTEENLGKQLRETLASIPLPQSQDTETGQDAPEKEGAPAEIEDAEDQEPESESL